MSWLKVNNESGAIAQSDIPVITYQGFMDDMLNFFEDKNCHCGAYFGDKNGDQVTLYCLMLNDATSEIFIASYQSRLGDSLPSLTPQITALHLYEREIWERYGITFEGHPWLKPVRYPSDRYDQGSVIQNYPFYKIAGESLHEVNVGPIHAGIIEPGVFRFICNGEIILHLETAFGYQHRGIERRICSIKNLIGKMVLSESIAGDSSVSHATAACKVFEKLSSTPINSNLELERTVALEMERIAMHIADIGALCMDMGYQLGQVSCEALRTMTINTTQTWCGNRFGKGIIRPEGTNYPVTAEMCEMIIKNIKEIGRRMSAVGEDIFSESSMLERMEDLGVVTLEQTTKVGAVGLAARASAQCRDIRKSHPFGSYVDRISHKPITTTDGDVASRMKVRLAEIRQSVGYVSELLNARKNIGFAETISKPNFNLGFDNNSLAFSFVEGWRGEICHVALTDNNGLLKRYKIKDPSFHNWIMLTLAVRGIDISEFPVYNKSFNLSYCGLDL